tara:strand:- start:1106 stop:2092 length:987 start_codon:yes stop_codon:yes gene_type:complete
MSNLSQMIREFRKDIGQSIEGLALLMQMEPQEFARLEKDWIPPDEILKRLCSLFEWNYKDIKRIAENSPNSKTNENRLENKQINFVVGKSDQIAPTPLAALLRESRNNARQNTKGISTLLGVSFDYYEEIEAGLVPPDNILRKLCSLYGWNYKQIQQKIKTQSTHILGTRQPPLPVSEIQARIPKVKIPDIEEFSQGVPLHEQIKQARLEADQNVEGISLLLQINPEYYRKIELGDAVPEPELLKKISTLYGWNYHEILNREKSSKLSQFQPTVTFRESPDSTVNDLKLRETQAEIAENWRKISKDDQKTLLTQLEFIRDSMKNLEVE